MSKRNEYYSLWTFYISSTDLSCMSSISLSSEHGFPNSFHCLLTQLIRKGYRINIRVSKIYLVLTHSEKYFLKLSSDCITNPKFFGLHKHICQDYCCLFPLPDFLLLNCPRLPFSVDQWFDGLKLDKLLIYILLLLFKPSGRFSLIPFLLQFIV